MKTNQKESQDQRLGELDHCNAERAKADEELALLRRFAESSGQGLAMADLAGRMVYVNPELCRLLGEPKNRKT